MFGLRKCTEEDFYGFGVLYEHRTEAIDETIMVLYFVSSLFLVFGYFVISQFNKRLAHIFGLSAMILGLIDLAIFMIGKIEKKKYIFRFQRSLILILIINWMVFPLTFYIMPLTLSYYQFMPGVFYIVIAIISTGFIYLIINLLRLVYLTYKGKMREGSDYWYERYIDNRLICLWFIIPGLSGGAKGDRRFTQEMNEAGNAAAPMLVIAAVGLLLQIIFFSLISEAIVILYCKCRYESFNDSYEFYIAGPKQRKKLLNQDKEKEHLKKLGLQKKKKR